MPSPTAAVPCDQCSRPILWTVTAAGRRLAVNPDPDSAGNTAVYVDGAGTARSRRITTELPALPYEWCAMPHVATCPAPRRPRRRRTAAHRRGRQPR